ncbi:MAG: T9SS type A sorting domain-containing protein [Cyclobacteriaceae bacterium]|nr:T9SS type A sorting domain-containing protein [Cyclobacteriaceae bacterium]
MIKENDLVSNSIILNNLNLFSKEFASAYQWLKNGVPISGATARSYAFNGAAGEYAVITYSSTCNMISPPLVITGIEQLPGENFVVFPNPAKSQINVSSTIEAPSSIRVFDIIGNLKIETQILGNEPIDISCLSSGLYILELDKNNVKLRTKFIVAK